MGLFDFFRRKQESKIESTPAEKLPPHPIYQDSLSDEEAKLPAIVNPGRFGENHIITFEARKRTAIPSERGLYPAEILLLHYCTKGHFPHPKSGYQGFWWYEYGINDVDAILKTLETRGFIALASIKESAKTLTIPQLKEILATHGLALKGKKAELVERSQKHLPDAVFFAAGLQQKYQLTKLGKQELEDNAYVPYMHQAHGKTSAHSGISISVSYDEEDGIKWETKASERSADDTPEHFNVWSINKLLGSGNKSDWKTIVETQERIRQQNAEEQHRATYDFVKENDPEGYQELLNQDKQIEAVQSARKRYHASNDLDAYIQFWEQLWSKQGLIFEGVGWTYELALMYIKAKRYDDAEAFVRKIMRTKEKYYHNRGESLLEEIARLRKKKSR